MKAAKAVLHHASANYDYSRQNAYQLLRMCVYPRLHYLAQVMPLLLPARSEPGDTPLLLRDRATMARVRLLLHHTTLTLHGLSLKAMAGVNSELTSLEYVLQERPPPPPGMNPDSPHPNLPPLFSTHWLHFDAPSPPTLELLQETYVSFSEYENFFYQKEVAAEHLPQAIQIYQMEAPLSMGGLQLTGPMAIAAAAASASFSHGVSTLASRSQHGKSALEHTWG